MSRRQARPFRPALGPLEERLVLSLAAPAVVASVAPPTTPPSILTQSTYHHVLDRVDKAFVAYEGPYDETLNALGNVASFLVSSALSSNDPNANSTEPSSIVAGGKGDSAALENRLRAALVQLPGGPTQAESLINRAFAYGGLNPSDAGYFRARLRSFIEHSVTQGVQTGAIVMFPLSGHHRS